MSKKTKEALSETATVFIPKENKHDDALYVAVNGQRLLVRKGEPVSLPLKFAEVIENSFAAAKRAESFIDAVSSEN